MKLGLIAYAENTGLGSQTKAYFDHLNPFRTMVLDRSGSRDNTFYPERFPGATIVNGLPSQAECEHFLQGVDVLLAAELLPTDTMMRIARQYGVKVVLVPNYEYFWGNTKQHTVKWQADLLLVPSKWHYEDFPQPKIYFPLPLEPKKVRFARPRAQNFLHIVGKPIFPDRNGTETLIEALQYIQSNVTITIHAGQMPARDLFKLQWDDSIKCTVRVVRDEAPDNEAMYADQDVLIMPRRFGGLCLPANEALAHGMPVIMPDISPNNQWLPKQWLVPAEKMATRELAHTVDVFDTDAEQLARLIDMFAGDEKFLQDSRIVAAQMAYDYSWHQLGPKLLDALQSVLL